MAKRLFVLEWLLIALMLVALGWPTLFGLVYTQNDLGSYHLPTRFFYARSLAMGESFAWTSDFWSGFYLHGEGEVGMYHPLHLLLYRLLPLDLAFNLEVLLSYPFMLVGTFLWLRRWALPRDAALFGAFVFTFSGWNLLQHVHPNMIAVVAHIPWLLLAIESVMCDESPRRVANAKLSVALLTLSQILLGHPQFTFLSSVLEILYLLFRIPSWSSNRRLLALAEAKFIGILSSSIQLIPTLDMLADSARASATSAYAYTMSLHPMNLLQYVAPYFLNGRVFYWGWGITHEFGLYNGAIASLSALWIVVRNKALGPLRPLAWGAIGLALFALLLALGRVWLSLCYPSEFASGQLVAYSSSIHLIVEFCFRGCKCHCVCGSL